MLRIFKELFNPKLKCQRVGRKTKTRHYSGYERTLSWSAVADEVSGEILYCPRCGFRHQRTVTKRHGIQGLTCPQSMMDKIREEGFCET